MSIDYIIHIRNPRRLIYFFVAYCKICKEGSNPLLTPEQARECKHTSPEINISPVSDIVSGSRHFVPVTRHWCRSSVYDILLKFENLPVIVTGRKQILSVTYEIVPNSDR